MLHDFSPNDCIRLAELGVLPTQVERLRYACAVVQMHISPPAARNDVVAILEDVAKYAERLLQKTVAVGSQASAAHGVAHALIEQGYWEKVVDDDGPTSFVCLAPKLKAMRDAAREGVKQLPSAPSRRRSADPTPVRVIHQALRLGWTSRDVSEVFSARFEGEREIKTYTEGPQWKPYPRKLRPSSAEGSAFRKIVGICYEAMGGNPDPLAAIKGYLKAEQGLRAKQRAAIDAAIVESTNKPQRRTSRKK